VAARRDRRARGALRGRRSPDGADGRCRPPVASFATTFAGGAIAPGEAFFVNVVFERVDQATSFTARHGVTTAPEPATYALLATGLAGLAVVARRRTGRTGRWNPSPPAGR
jgi:hypothetical protein